MLHTPNITSIKNFSPSKKSWPQSKPLPEWLRKLDRHKTAGAQRMRSCDDNVSSNSTGSVFQPILKTKLFVKGAAQNYHTLSYIRVQPCSSPWAHCRCICPRAVARTFHPEFKKYPIPHSGIASHPVHPLGRLYGAINLGATERASRSRVCSSAMLWTAAAWLLYIYWYLYVYRYA